MVGGICKITEGIPKLIKQKLIKKAQEKYAKIKRKLRTDNRNWDGWKFQLHWSKLEWVNPISKIKENNIQLLQRNTILIKMIEQLIGLAIYY